MVDDSGEDANGFVVVPRFDINGQSDGEEPHIIQEIKTWLSPTDTTSPASEYRKHLNSHVAGTGKWILDTNQYRRWSETDEIGDLWIRGIPGSGKSVVAASMIRRLQQRGDAPVLFFFFREIIEANRTPQSLARDFCNGLLDHCPSLQSALNRLRGQNSTVGTTPFSELWKCLSSALVAMPKVYCVVDALDEMEPGHDQFLQDLLDLGRKSPKSIKLMLTSRQLPHLEKHLGGSCLLDLRLDRRNVDRDIAIYISKRLESKASLTEEEATAIKTAICDRGKGLFLYARLVTDQLLLHPTTITSQLAQLPDGLGSMYTDILRDHAARSETTEAFQRMVLEWIVYSARPLRLLELAAMVDSLPDCGGLSAEKSAKLAIRSTCGPLLEVCEDGVIQIIHHSLTEFLLDRDVSHIQDGAEQREFPVLDPETAHENITRTCVSYLISCCLNGLGALTDRDGIGKRALWRRFHFLRYASTNWLYHAAEVYPTDDFVSFLDAFFHQPAYFEPWVELWDSPYFSACRHLSPLHVAAHSGLCAYAEDLLVKGADPECLDSHQQTPLTHAAMEGHGDIAQLLLNYNACYDSVNWQMMTPLHYAAKLNHAEVAHVLLAAGADPLAPIQKRTKLEREGYPEYHGIIDEGETAMSYACQLGNVSVFMELLDYVDPKVLRKGAFLHLACKNKQAEIVRLLLNHEELRRGINDRDQQGNTPLYLAAKFQSSATVQVLLDHGADISFRSLDGSTGNNGVETADWTEIQTKGFTPVHGWAYLSHLYRKPFYGSEQRDPDVLQLLIKAGSDVNATDHRGRTSLLAWPETSCNDHSLEIMAFISSLLENGADASITDLDGENPLHRIRYLPYEEGIIEILVQAGADINAARKSDGKTPIHIAADERSLINPEVFARVNGNFQKQDLKGNTPLHCFMSRRGRFGGTVERWHTLGLSHMRNHAGRTPLHEFLRHTVDEEPNKSLGSLMKLGSDLECRDNAGLTALLTALSRTFRHRRLCIPELLRLGADAKVKDFRGKSALHYAVNPGKWSGDENIDRTVALVRMLIDAGADVNSVDHEGDSIFHETITGSWHCSKYYTQALVEINAPLYLRNNMGRTALHVAALIDDADGTKDTRKGLLSRLEYLLLPAFEFDVNAKDNRGVTPLHLAAATSDINTRQLISHGADLLAKTNEGRTALHYAAEAGQSNCVGLLLEVYQRESVPLNDESLEGRTALHEAARSGRYESVRLLLNAGARPDICDRRGRTPLHCAAEFDRASALRRKRQRHESTVLQKHKDAESGTEKLERLGLIISSEEDTASAAEVVKLLLAAGVDPDQEDNDEFTASDIAGILGMSDVVDELLPHMSGLYSPTDTNSDSEALPPTGAVISGSTREALGRLLETTPTPSDGSAILKRAISTGDLKLVEALLHSTTVLDENDITSGLNFCARWGLLSMARSLLPHVHHVDELLPSLLDSAAERSFCNIEMVKLLTETASCNYLVDRSKQLTSSSALHRLVSGRYWWHPQALAILLEAGADTEVLGKGETLLQTALQAGRPGSYDTRLWCDETFETLIRFGADVDASSTQSESSPLQDALANNRDTSIIQKLLDNGASIEGELVVASAIRAENAATLELILKAGADPNVVYTTKEFYRDNEPETPLKHASGKNEVLMELLLAYGANPHQPLYDGTSSVLHRICDLNARVNPIIKAGYDLEIRDSQGRTPLLIACMLRRTAYYRMARRPPKAFSAIELINAGVDVRAQDDSGSTALHYALSCGWDDIVEELLQRGASPVVRNKHGLTPLHCALAGQTNPSDASDDDCYIPSPKLVRRMIAAGADPVDPLPDGRTALHSVIQGLMEYTREGRPAREASGELGKRDHLYPEYLALYQELVDAGCSREARDNEGNTPLFAYVRNVREYHSDVEVRVGPDLEDMRATLAAHNIHAVNDNGDTLLHAVASRGDDWDGLQDDDVMLFKLLVDMGLDPAAENNDGATSLDFASDYDRDEILAIFARDE